MDQLLGDKFKNFGWETKTCDGHNIKEIFSKIKKKECIYESGVIINFSLIKKKVLIGNIS